MIGLQAAKKGRGIVAEPIENHFKHCPRCGCQQVAAGNVPFRCNQCDFADFFGPVAAVGGLVINAENELLLVRRARDPGKGKWGLPGGFVDREESIEEALAREILEETRLHVVRADYLMSRPNQYNYRGIVSPVIDLFYVCQVDADDSLQLAADELEAYEWTHPEARHLDNMAFHSNRLAIEHWLSLS